MLAFLATIFYLCCVKNSEYHASWYKKNKTHIKAYQKMNKESINRRRRESEQIQFRHVVKYGLDKESYLQMLKNQNYRCKICGVESELLKAKLHIDHDHTTGIVRGLLCRACNHGIGNFKDSVELLNKAVDYLRSSKIN